ncbi:MlaD family protein [Tundrisphaera lichenicola]|uniref:MlaD family protein n=1 Tax=Tundrisphaera lichenicola TaxID=2029860 RepID=UPI003EB9FB34
MRREMTRWRALSNAVFVLTVLGMGGYGLRQITGRNWSWQPTFHAKANFSTISGIEVGAKVRVQGIDAGVVESIEAPSVPGGPVVLRLRLDHRLHSLIRSDATARIVPQSIVGAKIVEIVPGLPDSPPLVENASLASEAPIELVDLLKEASHSLKRVDAVAQAAEQGLGEINVIASSIREGKGSLGKLVRDDEAYQKIVSMSDRGTKAIDDLGENLAALKRTWPLSRYFDDKGFYDRERVLFKPGSERDSRTLKADELFEVGRSVLTEGGRKRLDEVAAWFAKTKRPKSEVVIAAFTDEARDADLAQILTQEQADSVRRYLVTKHKIDSLGWFSSRKVASVGFGSQVPRGGAEIGAPTRRVEVILFTPQA